MSLMNTHPTSPSVEPWPIPKTATMKLCQFWVVASLYAVVRVHRRLYSICAKKKQLGYGRPTLKYARMSTRG
eukprot:406567-Ditylum_brightwellii.AAC.3